MTGILAPPKREQVEVQVGSQTYVLRDMNDLEIATWTRERRATDEMMFQLRQRYPIDAELTAAIDRGEIK